MPKNLTAVALVWGILACPLAISAAEPSVSELIEAVRTQDDVGQAAAIRQLLARSDEAAEAVPVLIESLQDDSPDIRARAAECLGYIGKPALSAVPALAERIGDPDAEVRREAIEAVNNIRPGPEVVVPLFVKTLQDADPAARGRALAALANQGKAAVPSLLVALEDPKSSYWACLVISEIGPEAAPTVPALTKLLDSPQPDVRREAIMALAAIGPKAASAVPALVKALDDPINNVSATYALGVIGHVPPEADAKIEKNSKSNNTVLATVSTWALAKLHPNDPEWTAKATRVLIDRLMDKSPAVRRAAARGLLDLRPSAEIIEPLWQKALESQDEEVVATALDAMADLGAPAVPRLIDALRHDKAKARAVYVLGNIGPDAAAATEPLAELLKDPNLEVRREVPFALAKIGPAAKAAVPALVEALKVASQEEEGPQSYAICYALGSIGPSAMAAKPTLQKMLDQGKDASASMFSAWALTKIDPACEACRMEAVPVLIQALADPDPVFRFHAADALGDLGSQAMAALPALNELLHDPDPRVRQTAAEAVKAIGK